MGTLKKFYTESNEDLHFAIKKYLNIKIKEHFKEGIVYFIDGEVIKYYLGTRVYLDEHGNNLMISIYFNTSLFGDYPFLTCKCLINRTIIDTYDDFVKLETILDKYIKSFVPLDTEMAKILYE